MRLPTGADQRAVMQRMLDRGVATRRGIMCAHLEPAYADLPLRVPAARSEAARDRCILLPLFAGMTERHAGSGGGRTARGSSRGCYAASRGVTTAAA